MFFFFSTTELGNRKKEKINVPTTGQTLTKSSSTCGLCSLCRYSITVTSCDTISLTREGSTVKFTAWGTEHCIFYGLQSCSCNSADTHTHTHTHPHPHPHPTHTHTQQQQQQQTFCKHLPIFRIIHGQLLPYFALHNILLLNLLLWCTVKDVIVEWKYRINTTHHRIKIIKRIT